MDNTKISNYRQQIGGQLDEFRLHHKLWDGTEPASEELAHDLIQILKIAVFPRERREGIEQLYFRARLGRGNRRSGNMVGGEEDLVSSFFLPPADGVGWGRANLVRHPVFYGASNLGVALAEVKARQGEEVFVAVWRSRNTYPHYAQFTISDHIQHDGLREVSRHKISDFTAQIARAGSVARVSSDAMSPAFLLASIQALSEEFLSPNHIVSSLIAHRILYHSDFDGIEYLDVKTRSSTNYALDLETAKSLRLHRVYACQVLGDETRFNRVGEPKGDRLDWRPMSENDLLENDPALSPCL